MENIPQDIYLEIMRTIRRRLDIINSLSHVLNADSFSIGETAAFHGRKIVEGVAFGCLVATENGLKQIPRDAKGQWNAEKILKKLKSKNISIFPSPSLIRSATKTEQQSMNVKSVVEGIPERRISHGELIAIYQRLHRWLHEINPYIENDREFFFAKYGEKLWDDLSKLESFIEKHFISISGEGFFCVLHDDQDAITKLVSLSKVEDI